MEINKTIPAKSISYGGTRKASDIKYIVIHYTGNTTDKAINNAKFYAGTNTRNAGAHYFVDATSVYQSIDDLKVAWAVGGSKYTDCATTGGGTMYGKVTNANSISIEMCSTSGAIASETLTNVIWLTKKLMSKYNISAGNVYRHFDVTGKSCPGWTGWIKSDCTKWKSFKSKLTANAESTNSTTTNAETSKSSTYYQKYTGASTSIVVALGACGEKNTSLANRKKIATANGIKNYTGTATQNEAMLKLLKAGKLKKA